MSGFLSAGYSFDAIDLIVPGPRAFWNGSLGNFWNSVSSSTDISRDTNFNTDLASGLNLKGLPGPSTDVFFAASGAANLDTMLGQAFGVQSITTLNGTAAASIGGAQQLTLGTGGLIAQAGSGGLTINAPVLLGANQTWNGAAAAPLTVNSVVSGSSNLTTAGNVVLNGVNT